MARRERSGELDANHRLIRDGILAATLGLVDAEGAGALTVRRMAAAADRSTMCVYSTFGNRAALVEAAWSAAASELEAAAVAGGPDGYLDWARMHPRRYAFVWEADAAGLELDPTLRVELLARLDSVLGGGWAGLHGAAVAERVRAVVDR